MDTQTLIEAIAKSLGIASSEMTSATSLTAEIGIDSIEMVKLCRDLKKIFHCNLEFCEVKEAGTVQNLLSYIQEKKQAS